MEELRMGGRKSVTFWDLITVWALVVAATTGTAEAWTLRRHVPVPTLRFDSDGAFKIVQVADMHYANGATTPCQDVLPEQFDTCSDLNTTAFLKRVIAEEKPNLLVFTGDNIMQEDCDDPIASLNMAFAPAIESAIPWAAVLGNHDQEGNLSRANLMSYITAMPHCVATLNPTDPIDGYGNYVVQIAGPPGSPLQDESVLNLYFVDSGDYSTLAPIIRGYGWIHETQSAWVKEVGTKLRGKGKGAPGLAYFHIPVPEFGDLAPGEFSGGVKQEAISCARVNSGFFTTLLEGGDVKAAFVGHDHVNDFCGDVHGIKLCYAGGFGYHAYGQAGWDRRTRVVAATLDRAADGAWQGGVQSIVTWKRLDNERFDTIDFESVWKKSTDNP